MISCAQHDYIEIACLYRIPVRLILRSGDEITGIALDTVRNGDRQECLKLQVGEDEQWVVLDRLQSMEAQVSNPHFERVQFDQAQ
ncbi:MAG: Rho-binding antiterminator [Sedimenticola sp.]|nr:Rho-binding antiterminator [Sedimenticola sp.]